MCVYKSMYNIYVHMNHDTRDLYSYTYTQILSLLVNIQLYSNGTIILNTCTNQVDRHSPFSIQGKPKITAIQRMSRTNSNRIKLYIRRNTHFQYSFCATIFLAHKCTVKYFLSVLCYYM